MSRATKVLLKACGKLREALLESDYLREDCEMCAEPLTQDEFDDEVEYCEGNEGAARKAFAKNYAANLKRLLKELAALEKAAAAVYLALPAVAEEQMASIQEFEYHREDES